MPVKVGQEIKIRTETIGRGYQNKKYIITKIYPNFVLAVDKNGNRRGITLGDLVINKIIGIDERLM